MPNIKHLRWQCRRGAKELDVMLTTYLEQEYMLAKGVEQQAFVMLLALEDKCLLSYFFLNNEPKNRHLRGIVAKIRTTFMH